MAPRNAFQMFVAILCLAVAGLPSVAQASANSPRQETNQDSPAIKNVVLITVDDMNYDSLGVTGCKVPDITPNIDRLAASGMRFGRAHVNIAVCQPCRSVLMTGLFPINNGAEGFGPVNDDVPTLIEILNSAGYQTGILGKVRHLKPAAKFAWGMAADQPELGNGRDPNLYYERTLSFINESKTSGKPFFLMANSHDPHRPFSASDQEQRQATNRNAVFPKPPRVYEPNDVTVPGFLPELRAVRREMAEYYTSVHRADATVGAILNAISEAGAEDDTVVMFLSDHGMPLPFAKTNCYLHSTLTPWIVRMPGVTKAGQVDDKHYISTIDFLPTVLEILNVPAPERLDGTSFLPLLQGEDQPGRETVLTTFHETSAKRRFEMRSVHDGRFGYIFNAWSDGETVFRNESQNGRTWQAMRRNAENNPQIAARVELFQHRVPEELYDYEKDPDALHNLIDDPAHRADVARMRELLRKQLEKLDDPVLSAYRAATGQE